MANISGTPGNDTLIGTVDNDFIDGGDGDDSIEGGGGNDNLQGGNGNDTLLGQAGADFLVGGAGSDFIDGGAVLDRSGYTDVNTVSYMGGPNGIYVNLSGITGDGSTGSGTANDGMGGTDTLVSVQFVQGTNNNDTIIGSSADIFEQIEGGAGNDSLDGGAITDAAVNSNRLSYQNATAGVSVDLQAGTADKGINGNDVISNFNRVRGSNSNDTLLGSGANEMFEGRGGDDTIDGRGGFDTVRYDQAPTYEGISVWLGGNIAYKDGQGGVDTLYNIEGVRGTSWADQIYGDDADNLLEGMGGNDRIYGGLGNDTLVGGDGWDTVSYETNSSGNLGFFGTTGAVNVNLATGIATGADGTDMISGFEAIAGSDFDDTLTGDSSDNDFEGNGGNDIIDGGDGLDRVLFWSATAGVNVNLQTNSATSLVGNNAGIGTDTLTSIELVVGTQFGDSLTGSTNNWFEMFEGGKGNDTIDGGTITSDANGNRVSYQNADGSVTVNLTTGTATGADGNDKLYNINQVRGSNFNDTLVGSDNPTNYSEFFEGRGGSNYIDGKGGIDIVRFDVAWRGVNINLATQRVYDNGQDSGQDTVIGIEGIQGTRFDDTLIGGHAQGGVTLEDGLIEFFRGGAGNDIIDGGQGYDRVDYDTSTSGVHVVLFDSDLEKGWANDGMGGTDTLYNIEAVRGSSNNDTLIGSDAYYESFEGGAGNDTIDGKGGWDRVDYRSLATTGVNVNLAGNTASDGQGGTDTLYNIEMVRGSNSNDTIIGDANGNKLEGMGGNDSIEGLDGNDTLFGGAGNDTLRGGNGHDQIRGGTGNDVIDGGDGYDVVEYWDATVGVNVNLATGIASNDGQGGADTLIGIEMVGGSNYNDTIIGDANDNSIWSGLGNDSISGGAGNDNITGGLGNDTLDGGDGWDWVRYDDATSAVTVNLQNGTATGGGGTDKLSNFEAVQGSNYNDTLTGDTGNNDFNGGAGNDRIVGGGGFDRVGYWGVQTGVSVNLATGQGQALNSADAAQVGTDTLVNISGAVGTNFADSLVGNADDNSFEGGGGNDTIDGGAGRDSVWYGIANGAVHVNLADGTAYDDGQGGVDTLISIENIGGSMYDDILVGSDEDNSLTGEDGNDSIDGGKGNDWLSGGAGNDTILGGEGSDILIGGGGNDVIDGGVITDRSGYTDGNTLSYEFDPNGIVMDLSGITGDGSTGTGTVTDGWGGTDTVSNVNFIRGSAHADSILGSSAAIFEMFYGTAGNDTIDGGTISNDGANRISYQNFATAVSVDLGAGTANKGSLGQDQLSNITQVRGSSAADSLVGSDTTAYTEWFEGRGGNDTIDGKGGYDMVRYDFSATTGISVNLAGETATDGQGGTDTLRNIEGVRGSGFADTLVGDGANNRLEGMGGNDNISGGAGNDTLDGGAGNDTLDGGDGDDSLLGGEGNDSLVGGAGNDTLVGGNGNDTLDGGDGADAAGFAGLFSEYVITRVNDTDLRLVRNGNTTIVRNVEYFGFNSGADVRTLQDILGNAPSDYADTLTGTTGDDNIDGGAGNDSISGLEGNDTLIGGTGNDTLVGGEGDDTYEVDSAADVIVELEDEGIDHANVKLPSGTYVLSEHVETATVTSTAAVSITGNEQDNVLTGNAAANTLTGNGGDDLLQGMGGNDTLNGGAGDDTLDGGAGTDRLVGGAGDDTYIIDVTTDVIVEAANEGTDTVQVVFSAAGTYTLGANLENATVATSNPLLAVNLTGNDLDNVLTGNAGKNVLNGGKGNDTIIGGGGNDTVDGGEGTDTLVLLGDRADYNVQRTGTLAAPKVVLTRGNGSDATIITASNIESFAFDDGPMDLATLLNNSISDFDDSWEGTSGNDTVNGLKGNDTLDGADGNDTLYGGDGNDSLIGSDGNDSLMGDAGNDTLLGGDGNDTLNGGAGNDRMEGGDGDDTYVVDVAGDVVVEESGEGTDLVQVAMTSGIYTLGANVENATVTSTGAVSLTGNGEDNVLTGNAAANTLKGMDGDDHLLGMAGNDTLDGGDGDDTLDGGLGNDKLLGGAGDDVLITGGGNDTVDGGEGDDTLVLVGNRAAWTLSRTAAGTQFKRGTETVTFSNIESVQFDDQTVSTSDLLDLLATAFNDTLVGDGTDNVLDGLAGNDVIYGNGGNDTLKGGAGNDTLYGGADDDILDGGAGNDRMEGGDGDDTYVVDVAGDVVVEESGEGTDLVQVAMTSGIYTLGANVENATVTSTGAVSLTGNGEDNVLTGNAAINTLRGGAGNDTLYGLGGNDILYGDDGNDVLYGGIGNDKLDGGAGDDLLVGGEGKDTLTGGLGADHFVFSTAAITAMADSITDFNSAQGDKIVLSVSVFEMLGDAGDTVDLGGDYLKYNATTGALTYDADGTGSGAAQTIAIVGTTTHPGLTAGDFVLIA